MPKYIEKVEKMTLPVIPTRGLVAFPSMPLNFELERELSIRAVEAATREDMYVLLLCQKDIGCVAPAPKDLYEIGTVCRIKQTLKSPDGIVRVLAEGVCRGTAVSFAGRDGTGPFGQPGEFHPVRYDGPGGGESLPGSDGAVRPFCVPGGREGDP